MAVKIKDARENYDRVRADLFGPGTQVLVGITEENGAQEHDGNKTVLDVAIWNEFGNGLNSPERAPLRSWFDNNRSTAEKWFLALMPRLVRGEITKAQLLDMMGLKIAAAIQKTMTGKGLPPPNAESTIRKKGSSTATVDTGLFRSKITHVVKKDGT